MITKKYIHESETWPAFTWDAATVSVVLERVNRHIGQMAGRLAVIGFEGMMQTTLESITHDIVASSEIEGVALNTQEVRSSVARKLGITIKDEREPSHYINGVVSMMLDAVMKFDEPLTHERLFGWHAALFPTGYSDMEPIDVAKYRNHPMKVISGTFGRERVHYVAPEAERVSGEMETFLQWFNDQHNHPASLVKSAIAHLWFVAIHPFDDGNGRISRALSDMVLSQTDGSRFRYFSISREINREKKHYYDILERTTSRTSNDLTEWILWYLGCIDNAVTESETLLSGVLSKSRFWQQHAGVALSERQQAGLNIFLDGYEAKLSVKNWARLLEVSQDTASRDVKDLVAKQILRPVKGRVRDVSYAIIYSNEEELLSHLTDLAIEEAGDYNYLTAIYDNMQQLRERITALDYERCQQGEFDLQALACKYFAYIR